MSSGIVVCYNVVNRKGGFVDSFEMREEIDYGGRRYFLQTSFVREHGCIQSSFFKNGVCFDTVQKVIDTESPPATVRELTKELHLLNKQKFGLLLEARDKIKSLRDPVPHLKLAQVLYRRNLFTEAIQEALQAVEKGEEDSLPFIVIGESYYRMAAYGKAFDAIQKGIDINPDYPDLHNLLGQVYLKQNKCRLAIDRFKHAIGLNLYYGEPYLNLSRAYLLNTMIKEDYELSRKLEEKFVSNLDRAAQLSPIIRGEAVEEAKQLFGEQKYDEVLELLERLSIKSDRTGVDDIVLELYLMILYSGEVLEDEDIEQYLARVSEVIDQNPTYADGYNSLGILYTAKCKVFMDRACEAFRRALEINKNYRRAQKNLRLAENDRQGIFILLKALLD